MTDPKLVVTSVTVSTPAPVESATFYARLLRVELTVMEPPGPGQPPEAGFAQLRTDHLTVNFEFERHWTPIVWPAEAGRQTATQHLDIHVDDLDAAVAWAVGCGARLAEVQPQDDVRVLFDPVGHPFCLFT